MIRLPYRIGVLGAFFVVLLASWQASAQGKVPFLLDQLKNATDFRVRTQAALALGASDDPSAVAPLCDALDDSSTSVRSAAAAALGKLKSPAGVPCLRDHASETNASVRSVIERSLGALQGSSAWPSKPPPPGPNDTYYVAIGPVADKTGRDDKTVEQLVGSTMQDKLLSLRGYAVAPQGESAPAARRVVKQKSLRGYLLQTRVEPLRTGSNGLTVQVRVTMWSYPDKALQGEFSPKLTMQGASAGDKESEDNLIKMAIENAIESFAKVTASTN
jgi:HEAT repeats